MARQRSDSEQQIAELLRTATSSLQISVAFLSRLGGTTQHVDPAAPRGRHAEAGDDLCQAVIDGDLPPVSRFPADCGKAPDVCFAEAHSVGKGHVLELLALERAAEHLAVASGYVAIDVSPATLLTPECSALMDRLPLGRVLLELSEHDPVEDDDALAAVLQPLRARGVRLTIDDVGADPVLRTLVGALVDFAHGCGATLVAEGVETAEDPAALLELGVDDGQGWHFGRPGPADALDGPAPVPAPVLGPVPVPRRSGWLPWSASRGRRRAAPAPGSYAEV